jgi:hypothetical protein
VYALQNRRGSNGRYRCWGKKATLHEALSTLDAKQKLHPALVKGFKALYGYAGDADGIRHALMDEWNLTAAEAKFFLLSCTSFINYLKTKI